MTNLNSDPDHRSRAFGVAVRFGILLAATLFSYWPALRGGFIWDDDRYVTENETLRSAEGLKEIWLNPAATPQYYPLVHTTFWIEQHLWGLRPFGYHLANVLLHALNATLLWALLARLRLPGAWIAAMIFALHPVEVESVAWITERKNVLSGAFYLSSLLAFLSFSPLNEETSRRRWGMWFISLALFAAALLSKTVTATLPVVILILIWWQQGSVRSRDFLPLLPFLALGLAMGLSTAWLEKHQVGAQGPEWKLSMIGRCLVAGRAIWFYAGKTLFPVNLAFIYPRWRIDPGAAWQYSYPGAFVALIALLWSLRERIGRCALAAVLMFAVTLAPALGFLDVFPFKYSYVADHFQYLASIAVIALVVGTLSRLAERFGSRTRLIPAAIAMVVILLLGGLTWRQGIHYKDEETLWSATLDGNPDAIIAYNNLGTIYAERGDYPRARKVFDEGLAHAPGDADLLGNLGGVLVQLGEWDEASKVLRAAAELEPTNPWTLNNLGLILMRQNKPAEAVQLFSSAMQVRPTMTESYNNLATALAALGRREEAIQTLREGLKVEPANPTLQSNLKHQLAGER